MAALRAGVFPLSAKNRRGGHFFAPPPSSARVNPDRTDALSGRYTQFTHTRVYIATSLSSEFSAIVATYRIITLRFYSMLA